MKPALHSTASSDDEDDVKLSTVGPNSPPLPSSPPLHSSLSESFTYVPGPTSSSGSESPWTSDSVHAPPGFVPSAPTSPVIPLLSLAARLASAPAPTPVPAPSIPRSESLAALKERANKVGLPTNPTPITTLPVVNTDISDKFREDKDALLKTIANLRAERKVIEAKAMNAVRESEQLKSRLIAEERQRSDIEARLAQIVAEIVGLEDAKTAADTATNSAMDKARHYENQNTGLRAELRSLQSDRDELRATLSRLQDRRRATESEHDQLKLDFTQRTADLAIASASLSDTEKVAARLRAEQGQATTALQRVTDEIRAISTSKSSLEATVASLEKDRSASAEQLANLRRERNERNERKGKLEEMEKRLVSQSIEIENLRTALGTSEARTEHLSDDLVEQQRKSGMVENKMAKAEVDAKTVEGQYITQVTRLESEVLKLRTNAKTEEEIKTKLLQEKAEMGDLIDDLLDALQVAEAQAQSTATAGASSCQDEDFGDSSTPTASSFATPSVSSSEPASNDRRSLLDVTFPSGSFSSPEPAPGSHVPPWPKTPSKISKNPISSKSSTKNNALIPIPPAPTSAPHRETLAPNATESPPSLPTTSSDVAQGPHSPGSSSSSSSSYHSHQSDDQLGIGEAGLDIGGGSPERAMPSDSSDDGGSDDGSDDADKTVGPGGFVGSIFFAPIQGTNGEGSPKANVDAAGKATASTGGLNNAQQDASTSSPVEVEKSEGEFIDASRPAESTSSGITSQSTIEALLKIAESISQKSSMSDGGDDSEEEL